MRNALFLLALAACGQTEATRRTFPISVAATLPTAPTSLGWTVSVSEVCTSLAALRFFSGGVSAQRWSPSFITAAWAHPGGFQAGAAMAEVLTPVEVDVAATETAWGLANAVTGTYATAELTLGTMGVRLRGTATKGPDTVPFDTGTHQPSAPIKGLRFARSLGTEAGRVVLTLNVANLVDRIDFSKTGVAAAGAAPFDVQSPAYNGFARAIVDAASYTLTWSDE